MASMPSSTVTASGENSARLPSHEWFISCQRELSSELKSSRKTSSNPPLLDEPEELELVDELELLDELDELELLEEVQFPVTKPPLPD